MITDMPSYLKFFETVRRRTDRDVAALPPAAAAWRPPAVDGEAGWSIGQIVDHIGGTRLYFASAYRNEGWLWAREGTEMDAQDQRTWLPWLDASAKRFVELLADTPNEWLTRRIEMIDTPGRSLSGWRLLMMMLEHEVHHRGEMYVYLALLGVDRPPLYGVTEQELRERSLA